MTSPAIQSVAKYTPRYNLQGNLSERKRVEMTKVEFCEKNFYTDQGSRFRIGEDREYWKPIYNVPWRNLVVMSSRQAEKSTFASKSILADVFMQPNDSIMFATASNSHRTLFNHQKIEKQFDYNERLRDLYLGPHTINNVGEKIFSNNSTLFLRSIGQNPQSARGPSARKVYFDEVQSIISDNIPIAREVTQAYPDTSAYYYLGTPLTPQNHLSLLYDESLQYEWIITCQHCTKDNPPLGKEHIDFDKPYLFCIHCGNEMDAKDGRWVSFNEDGNYPGFRICRLMTPTCRWRSEARDGVLDKAEDYPKAQFVNEVLGIPEGSGVYPIDEKTLYSNCDSTHHFMDPNDLPEWITSQLFIGTIDWAWNSMEGGRSYTIFAVWQVKNDRVSCVYAKRQTGPKYDDPEYGLKEMVRVFTRFGVKMVGTDFGIGHKENARLRSMMHSQAKIFEIMYAGRTEKFKFDDTDGCYHLGRTASLDLVFSKLEARGYMFPIKEESKEFVDDVKNIYIEYDPNHKRKKYEHSGTGPDDFAHLMNYANQIFLRNGMVD